MLILFCSYKGQENIIVYYGSKGDLGKDAELERLPDSIAAGLLKSLVALSATKLSS